MASSTLLRDPHPKSTFGPYSIEFSSSNGPRADEYRLRYDAFVTEHGWLPADASRPGLERDACDDASCAFLVRELRTGAPVACQRLILPDLLPRGVATPIEQVIDHRVMDFRALAPESWGEVSRTTIAPAYRGHGRDGISAMHAIKYASLALAIATARYTLFSLSDPRTARLCRLIGTPLHQIGGPVEHHGTRTPFRIDIREVLAHIANAQQHVVDALAAAARAATARSVSLH